MSPHRHHPWAHPQKYDVMVLDFVNDPDGIQSAMEAYYRTTLLSEETDPNKLHDLKSDLDGYEGLHSPAGRRLRDALPVGRQPLAARPDP
jgi:hypothetical protein